MKKNILIYPFIFLLILLISILFGAKINLKEVGIKSTSILTVVNSITKRCVDKFLETKVKLKSNSQTKSIIDSKQKKQNDSLSDESKEFYVEANSYKENFLKFKIL